MEIKINNKEIYSVLQRFYAKYKLRRHPGHPNPNKLSNYLHDFYIVKIYKRVCTYSNNENSYKDNLVIKYKYKNVDEVISLNIPWEDYKDLLVNN